MFQQIDIAIGFTVVMLLLSLVITTTVQIVVALGSLRGRNLRDGLAMLLKQIAPELRKLSPKADGFLARGKTLADEVAYAVTSHPALTKGLTQLKAIRLEELTKVLKEIASDQPIKPDAITESARTALRQALAFVQNEQSQLKTLEQKAADWFDAVMDRTSEVFALRSRMISILSSIVLVAVLQIDAVSIWRQISKSPEIQASLTRMSADVEVIYQKSIAEGQKPDLKDQLEQLKQIENKLADTGVNIIPDSPQGFTLRGYTLPQHLIGMLLAAIMLSLGAPFWFNALRELSALKPLTAKKIEKESGGK